MNERRSTRSITIFQEREIQLGNFHDTEGNSNLAFEFKWLKIFCEIDLHSCAARKLIFRRKKKKKEEERK